MRIKTNNTLVILIALMLSSCNYLDSLEPDKYEVVNANSIEQNPYAPYSNISRKGYYINDLYPNDKLIDNSYRISDDGGYSINLDGRWKVVKAVLYSKSGSQISRVELYTLGRGFISKSAHNFLEINKTIININNGSYIEESYPDEKYNITCNSNYNNTKFGELNISTKNTSNKIFIVDINQDITQMVLQTCDYYGNASFDSNYIRYILIRI